MSGALRPTYPRHAVDAAVTKILWWGRFTPVAIDVTRMSDEDTADLLTTWHRIGKSLSFEPCDLCTFVQPEGSYDVTAVLRDLGARLVDYPKLVESCL